MTDPDYLLTPEQLDEKYNPNGGGEHPAFTRDDWRNEVHHEYTLQGYWQWVFDQLTMDENQND
jgi:hypothetical protein